MLNEVPATFQGRVDAQHRLWRISDSDTAQYCNRAVLQSITGDSHHGRSSIIMVTCLRTGVKSYHNYKGGPHWIATIPGTGARPGEDVTISARVPSCEDFVQGLTRLSFQRGTIRGYPDTVVQSTGFTIRDSTLMVSFSQNQPIEGTGSFELSGKVSTELKCTGGKATLSFTVEDVFGLRRLLALIHNGHDKPSLGIKSGGQFYTVGSIHSDGLRVRIKFWVNVSNPNVVTLYSSSPEELYQFGEVASVDLGFALQDASRTLVVANVEARRHSERAMLEHGRKYDLGRVGAEIAYAIATKILLLKQVVLNDPSKGGKDLFTRDETVVIQSRLLARTQYERLDELQSELRSQLKKLCWKIRQDFEFNRKATKGYAIISYVTASRRVRSIIVEYLRESLARERVEARGPGRI